jgi:ribonuclease HI
MIRAYLDGGGAKNHKGKQLPATWGVVLLGVKPSGKQVMIGWIAAPVAIRTTDPQYFGAESQTSGAAELSAELWLAILLINMDFQLPVQVLYDSRYAAEIVQARSGPKIHRKLAAIATVMWQILTMRLAVEWIHVKAHSGEPFNELVDAICWLTAEDENARTVYEPASQTWVWEPIEQIRLKYLLWLPSSVAAAYPAVEGGTIKR